MTIRLREHAAELASALHAVEAQSLIHAVIVCHDRNPKHLRRYLALCEREHGADNSITTKALRLLADAEQVAELERMAGL
jgi:hypothetical protein